MSERAEGMTLGECQEFVASRIFKPGKPGWEGDFATYIQDELDEVMAEYHQVSRLLLSGETTHEALSDEPAAEAMLDEVMDMNWFGFAAAQRSGLRAGELCIASLERHTGRDHGSIVTLEDLQDAVVSSASRIELTGKWSEVVVLENDPMKSLHCATRGLSRALTAGDRPSADRKEAIGDYLNTISYMVAELGWPIEQAVMYNIVKLWEREPWGKGKLTAVQYSYDS